MTHRGDILIETQRQDSVIDSVRASRRGMASQLLGLAMILALALVGYFPLVNMIQDLQHQISSLKNALTEEQQCKIDPYAVCGAPVAPRANDLVPPNSIKTITLFGKPGKDGKDGTDGRDGTDGSPGATGETGPRGAAGRTGATGKAGGAGAKGATGQTGAAGAAGQAGIDGATGERGPEGPTGAVGPVGATGPQGPIGEPGKDGKDGKDGETPKLPVFVIDVVQGGECSATVYFSDDTTKSLDLC